MSLAEDNPRKRTWTAALLDGPDVIPTYTSTIRDQVDAASRDSDFWFEDGNIILISQGVAFRVYRGLLAEHSGVFKSMLHVAQAAPDAAEQAYGCDVVQLDDLAEDLRGLFKIIFPLSKNLK